MIALELLRHQRRGHCVAVSSVKARAQHRVIVVATGAAVVAGGKPFIAAAELIVVAGREQRLRLFGCCAVLRCGRFRRVVWSEALEGRPCARHHGA